MAPSTRAQSRTVFVIGDAASLNQHIGVMPYRLTRVKVGRNPTALQQDAGPRPEPPVSSPTEAAHRCAANATPEPLLDSPGVRSRSQGFRGMPYGGCCVPPMASSLRLSLPSIMAPAALRRVTIVASSDGTKTRYTREPLVVRTPLVQN